MKKIIATMFGFLVLFSPMALAQPQEVNPGITPDQGFLYGLDTAMDQVRYALSMNKEATGLDIAKERLAENKQMIQEGKPEQAKKAMRRAERIMKELDKKQKKEIEMCLI